MRVSEEGRKTYREGTGKRQRGKLGTCLSTGKKAEKSEGEKTEQEGVPSNSGGREKCGGGEQDEDPHSEYPPRKLPSGKTDRHRTAREEGGNRRGGQGNSL